MKQLLYFFIIIFFLFCENVADYQEKEDLRNLYIYINLPDKNSLLKLCEISEQEALNCANHITNQNIYLATIRNFYSITISTPDPNQYCPDLIVSTIFTTGNYSIDAKRCHFECNQKFWENTDCTQNFNNIINTYSLCLPGIWSSRCEDSSFKTCLENCFLYGDPIWFIQ